MFWLPTELQLYILQLATHVPGLLEVTPKYNEIIYSDLDRPDPLDALVRDFYRSLSTRHALTLVSRSFNALATPILYACLHLTIYSSKLISSIDKCNASMVRHVIMDFPTRFETPSEAELASLFALLPNVHLLTICSEYPRTQTPHVTFGDGLLARTMKQQLGPTLRKLALQDAYFAMFTPSDLEAFTSSLVHLEHIFCAYIYLSHSLSGHTSSISLPASLPSLTHLNIDDTPFAFPADMAPTHVRCHLNDCLSFVLSPALTHLSLTIPDSPSYDAYVSLSSTSPNLVSLALSGTLSEITRVLTTYPLPPVSHLIFADVRADVENTTTTTEISAGEWVERMMLSQVEWTTEEVQAWVDTLMGLPAGILVVRVLNDEFVRRLRDLVGCGLVDVSELERCRFVVEDGEGRKLLNEIQSGTASRLMV